MEHERIYSHQTQWAPMRTLPPFRKARRPRRSVFRVPMNYEPDGGLYEFDEADLMDRDYLTNEYDFSSSIDDILSEFMTDDIYSDYHEDTKEHLFAAPEDVPTVKPRYDEHENIDSRFNLGGRPRWESHVPVGVELDQSVDEDYIHNRQDDFISSYTVSEDELDYDYEYSFEEPEESGKKSLFGLRRKNKDRKRGTQPKYVVEKLDEERIYEQTFRDVTGDLGKYADIGDYDDIDFEAEGGYGDEESLEGSYAPPSFSEYLASIFASVFYRIKGTSQTNSAETMEDSDEDLGRELSCEQAYKYYGSHIHFIRFRLNISAVLLVLMGYISLGFPVPGMLGYPPVTAAACMALQFTIMLLSLDVVTNGILKAARLNFGADSLAVFSCLVTTVDAIVIISSRSYTHMPLCALSCLSLVGISYSSLLSARGLRKAIRVPAIAKKIYSITGENDVKGHDITLLKTNRSVSGFVRRSEEAPPDETLFLRLAPLCLAISFVLSLLIAAITKSFHELSFIFSAVLAPAVPFTALLCFALPYFIGTNKIFHSGASIAGWSGLCDVGKSNNLIVTDRDLFPAGSIEIKAVIICGDEDARRVLSYAGSMMIASGCSAAQCFAEEMEHNGCVSHNMVDYQPLSGGGMKAIIDGHVVLCGSCELMRLMNVRYPYEMVKGEYPVMLAIDGVLHGIFKMGYTPLPLVRKALVDLMRSNRHPIFALRDFNITPDMLKDLFDIATDGYDFPPYAERYKITETQPSEHSKIAAVVCREGLAPLTSMADTGRSMYMATRINLIITALSAVLGMLVVFMKILTTGTISLSFILMFMLITALPVMLISAFMK